MFLLLLSELELLELLPELGLKARWGRPRRRRYHPYSHDLYCGRGLCHHDCDFHQHPRLRCHRRRRRLRRPLVVVFTAVISMIAVASLAIVSCLA